MGVRDDLRHYLVHAARSLYDPAAGTLPNPERLLAITRAGVKVLPASAPVRNALGHALLTNGRFADAVREVEEYARLAPREPNPFDSLGYAYVLLGEPAKAVEAYSRAIAIDREFPSRSGLAYALGMLGRFQEATGIEAPTLHVRAMVVSRAGRYADAERLIRDGIVRAESDGNAGMAGGLYLMSASLALERKDFAAVTRQVARARDPIAGAPVPFALNMSFIADTLGGLADLGLGHVARVQALADRQTHTHRTSNPVERLWHGVLKGELALVRGDPAGAASAFSAGELSRRALSQSVPGSVLTNNLILRDVPARAALARGNTSEAIRIYRRLLANGPELKWVSLYEPRYVLQLARLLDTSGDRHEARVEYRRFLELWTAADAHLPELAEARRALGRD